MSDKWKQSNIYSEWVIVVGGIAIAECMTHNRAEQIVREHNAFPGLVEACRSALASFEEMWGEEVGRTDFRMADSKEHDANDATRLIRAALKAAEPAS